MFLNAFRWVSEKDGLTMRTSSAEHAHDVADVTHTSTQSTAEVMRSEVLQKTLQRAAVNTAALNSDAAHSLDVDSEIASNLAKKHRSKLPEMVQAFQTSELSTLSSLYDQWGGESKVVMLRESLNLPQDSSLYALLVLEESWMYQDEAYLLHRMRCRIGQGDLLAVWAPSVLAPSQHIALINVQHPAFLKVQISAKRINFSNGFEVSTIEA